MDPQSGVQSGQAGSIDSVPSSKTGSTGSSLVGASGASHDEFSAGGYTPGAIDQADVETAIDSGIERESQTSITNGTIDAGNLNTSVQASPELANAPTSGDQHRDDAEATADAIREESADSGVDITEDLGIGAVVGMQEANAISEEDAEALVTDYIPDDEVIVAEDESVDAVGVDSVADLNASELGALEDIELVSTERGEGSGDAVGIATDPAEGDEAALRTGLFGTSDIDTTDLSYLDDADNSRFDFADSGNEPDLTASEASHPQAGTSTTDDSTGDTAPTELVPDAGMVATAPAVASGNEDANAAISTVTGISGHGTDITAGSIRGDGSGSCPADYPIKGNKSSKIYHTPEISSYQGTKAEWCFASEDDAIAAGFRAPGPRNAGGKKGAGPGSPTLNRPANSETQTG